MIAIRSLLRFDSDDFNRLATGYRSDAKYKVSRIESDSRVVLTLEFAPLLQPCLKRFDPPDEETLRRYRDLQAQRLSFSPTTATTTSLTVKPPSS